MSKDIEMAESSPSINSLKRKGVIQGESDLQEPGQGNSCSESVDDDAEPLKSRRTAESDDVTENPSSLGTLDEPLAQAGASLWEELQGDLVVDDRPVFAGGYANIYLGKWKSLDGTLTKVAVKRLKPIEPTSIISESDHIELERRREKRLKREVVVWFRLAHSNVHPLLGFRTQPGPCLVSPWCQNGNLANYLSIRPNLSQPEKLELLVQTADGLAFLHSQSPPICHADIKPENVLVNDLCEAALSDFGLSRVIQELDVSTCSTTGQGPKGTLRYMAPELFEEENPRTTLETDVYAFGGLTLAVMSGRPPFAQIRMLARVMFRILNGEHPKPGEHPALNAKDPIWSMMLRCWARDPRTRPTIRDVEFGLRKRKVSGAPDSQTERTSPITPKASNPRYFMQIHNMMQQSVVGLLEATFPQDPRQLETWTSTITVTSSRNGRGIGEYSAVASTKQGARDAASRQALIAVGIDLSQLL